MIARLPSCDPQDRQAHTDGQTARVAEKNACWGDVVKKKADAGARENRTQPLRQFTPRRRRQGNETEPGDRRHPRGNAIAVVEQVERVSDRQNPE